MFSDVLSWCNQNQGFVMVLLTGIYVVATIGLAFIGARANAISQKNMAVLAEIEQERSRPLVDVRLENEAPWLALKVTNHGQTPAYNVQIETVPRIQLLLGGDNTVPKEKTERQIGIIEHGIGTLGAGVCEEALVGSYARLRETNPAMRFTGKLTYRSVSGKVYESPINLDVRYMENSWHRSRKTTHDLVTEMEKIRSEIGHIATGFHKPHVITEDIEHKRAADNALAAEYAKECAKEVDDPQTPQG